MLIVVIILGFDVCKMEWKELKVLIWLMFI